MNDQYKDLDNLFRQRFEDFRKEPPESIWSGVKTGLSKPPGGGTSPAITGKTGTWLFSASCLLLVFLSVVYPSIRTGHQSSMKSRNTVTLKNNRYIAKTSIIIGNSAGDQVNDHPVRKEFSNNTNPVNNFPVASGKKSASKLALNGNRDYIPSKTHIQSDTKKQAIDNPAKPVDKLNPVNSEEAYSIAENRLEPVLYPPIAINNAIADNPPVSMDKIQPVNSDETYSIADAKIKLALYPEIDIKNVIYDNNKTKMITQDPGTIASIDKGINRINPKNIGALNEKIYDTASHLDIINAQANSNFYIKRANVFIGLSFIPEAGINPPAGKSSLDYGTELALGYKYKHWTIQSGAGLMFGSDRSRYQLEYKKNEVTSWYDYVTSFTIDSIPIYSEDSIIGYKLRPSFHTTKVQKYDSVQHRETPDANTYYTMLTIPLMAGYSWYIRKWAVSLKTGGIFTLLLKKKEPELPLLGKEARLLSYNRLSPPRSMQQWSFIIAPGINYFLTHYLSVGIEPYFKYSYSSGRKEKTVAVTPCSLGVRVGLTVNF